MQALKNTKIEYKEHYKGLSTEHLMRLKFPLEIREVTLLLEIIKLYNSKTLNWISVGTKKYVWINYGMLLAKFNGMHYTMKMLQKDLNTLERLDLLDRQEERKSSHKRIYFFITKKTDKMCIFDTLPNLSRSDTPQGT